MPLPHLATDRLLLQPFQGGDLDAFHALWSDPEVIWWGASASRTESEEHLSRIVEQAPAGLGWSWLVDRVTGTNHGDVVLQPAPNPPGGIEVGWHLARSSWGHGYATEGAGALIEHAWDLGLDQVIAMIMPDNLRSVAVAERLEMRRRDPLVDRGGMPHAIWVRRAPQPLPTPGR